MPVYWYNGQFHSDEFSFNSSNRAFRYGDGLFETIRICFGKAVFFHQHYIRFIEGMTFLKMDIPNEWSFIFLQNLVQECAAKNNHVHAKLRLTCWRNGGGLYTPEQNDPKLLIESQPLEHAFFQAAAKGQVIGIFPDLQKELGPASVFKSSNALPYVLAGIYAQEQKWDNALLLNREGFVADAVQSNVFLWEAGTLVTPAENQGAVNGVMRRTLLKNARMWGMPVEERIVTTEDLKEADEIFLTNTIQGISWVSQMANVTYDNKISSTLLGKLNELLPVS